jgi:hypothetical protein
MIAMFIPGAYCYADSQSEIDLDLESVFLGCAEEKVLKKEVIHPQLPLRVPCYDFVPVIDPTFRRPTATFGCYRLP